MVDFAMSINIVIIHIIIIVIIILFCPPLRCLQHPTWSSSPGPERTICPIRTRTRQKVRPFFILHALDIIALFTPPSRPSCTRRPEAPRRVRPNESPVTNPPPHLTAAPPPWRRIGVSLSRFRFRS